MEPYCPPWKSLPASPQPYRERIIDHNSEEVTTKESHIEMRHQFKTVEYHRSCITEDMRPNKRRGCSPNVHEAVTNIVIHEEEPNFSHREGSQYCMGLDACSAFQHHYRHGSPAEATGTKSFAIQENCLSVPTTIKRTRSLVVRETSPKPVLDSLQEGGTMRSKKPMVGYLHRSQSFTFTETLVDDMECLDKGGVPAKPYEKRNSATLTPFQCTNEATDDVFCCSNAIFSAPTVNASILPPQSRPFPSSRGDIQSPTDSVHSSAAVSGYGSIAKEYPIDRFSTVGTEYGLASTSSSDFLVTPVANLSTSCSNFKKRLRDRYLSSARDTVDSAISSPTSTMLERSSVMFGVGGESSAKSFACSDLQSMPMERSSSSLLERRRNNEKSAPTEHDFSSQIEKHQQVCNASTSSDMHVPRSSSDVKGTAPTPFVACLQYLSQQPLLSRPLYNGTPVNTPILEGINSYINRICRIESTSSNLSVCSPALMECESDPFSPVISPFGHPHSLQKDPAKLTSTSAPHSQLSCPSSCIVHHHSLALDNIRNPLPEVVISTVNASMSGCRPSPHGAITPHSAAPTSAISSFPRYHGDGSTTHPPQQHFIFPPPSSLLREMLSSTSSVTAGEFCCPRLPGSVAPSPISPATVGESSEALRNLTTALDLTTALSTAKLHRHSKLTWKRRLHSVTSANTSPFQVTVDGDEWDGRPPSIAASTSRATSSTCPTLGSESQANVISNEPSSSANVANSLYICPHCSRTFTRSDMLARHVRLHTGHKPYECSECDQKFSRSDHLSTHLRTHTGVKPYECSQCSYTACRKDMITRHMRVHARKGGRGRSHRAKSSSQSLASATMQNALHVSENDSKTEPVVWTNASA